jgi:hypothetical protein
VEFLNVWDLILSPFYLIILTFIAKRHRDKNYPVGHPLRQYYMPGLYVKFFGSIFIGLIYAYYYKGGDTFNYFYHTKLINASLDKSVFTWFKLITHTPVDKAPEIYNYVSEMYWYNAPPEYAVAVIAAFIGLLTNTAYLPTGLIFAFLAYSGIWAMFRTFVSLYPKLIKPLALAFLFIPSVVVWSSGVFKDTICMFGLGWMTHGVFRLFVNRDFSIKNFFLIAVSFYLIAVIKIYILIAFLPALMLWLLLTYSRKVQSVVLRWVINIGFITATAVGASFGMQKFAKELNEYSLDKLVKTANVTRDWTLKVAVAEQGSVYDIGTFDGSLGSLASVFPQAVVVSLFRPFPWEVRKVIVALSAIEAMILVYFTVKMFTSRKSRPVRQLVRDPNLLFCLVFSLIFAFAVGVSSGNFGTLSRYKIPCMPFYGAILAIMLGKEEDPETEETKKRTRNYAPAAI